ncbi:MAG TPA: NADP-dependent oxidoreductase [Solirubrobacteraceae bacterium]|jgi:NADPH:quinone reductase-like Zn-dependent oxidoreductase|nr:NADP-dependent oxidoreductase [Solirubrobacteraceae bacterium]
MRAVVIDETGGPEVLQLRDVERGVPGDGEVLIEVHAASVNPMDWKRRQGTAQVTLPAVLGSDVSGTIVESRAEGFAEGDDVFGFAASGAYAEFAVTRGAIIAHKPEALTHAQAAALPVAGLTAWQALFDRAQLARGQAAVIAGAAGGVGHLAVQLAKHAGAVVTGIGSANNRDFVLGLGADRYVDYTREAPADAVTDADVAFDAVGGEVTATLLETVREGGILVTIANAPPEQQAQERGARAELLVMSANAEQLAALADLLAGGEIRVEVSRTFPLAEVAEAHRLSESGHTRGKIVLAVSG